MRPFQRLVTEDQELNRVQQNMAEALRPVLTAAVLDGRLVEDVALATGQDNVVNHGLGRAVRGWLVVRQNAQADLWDTQASNAVPGRTLLMRTSATVTVTLWVF